nr:MAG TPA: hypothetical protein [Caudoviricetes sp.]
MNSEIPLVVFILEKEEKPRKVPFFNQYDKRVMTTMT